MGAWGTQIDVGAFARKRDHKIRFQLPRLIGYNVKEAIRLGAVNDSIVLLWTATRAEGMNSSKLRLLRRSVGNQDPAMYYSIVLKGILDLWSSSSNLHELKPRIHFYALQNMQEPV